MGILRGIMVKYTNQELTFVNPILLRDPPHFNLITEPHPAPVLKLAQLLLREASGDRAEFGSTVNGPDVDSTLGKSIAYFGRKWTTGNGLTGSVLARCGINKMGSSR